MLGGQRVGCRRGMLGGGLLSSLSRSRTWPAFYVCSMFRHSDFEMAAERAQPVPPTWKRSAASTACTRASTPYSMSALRERAQTRCSRERQAVEGQGAGVGGGRRREPVSRQQQKAVQHPWRQRRQRLWQRRQRQCGMHPHLSPMAKRSSTPSRSSPSSGLKVAISSGAHLQRAGRAARQTGIVQQQRRRQE